MFLYAVNEVVFLEHLMLFQRVLFLFYVNVFIFFLSGVRVKYIQL